MSHESNLPPRLARRGLLAAGLMAPAIARAQGQQQGQASDWPTQAVRYINLYAPGGATDIASRVWCQAMTQVTGQQFVVENRAGAGGTVGTDAIAKSRPDGYTLGLGSVATLAIAPSLFPSLPYDVTKDFTFISGLWRQPNLLLVNNDLPAHSVPELIALLKANPGKYNYATGGAGTTPHLCAEMFKMRTGTDMPFVQYRGGAPALLDLMAGRVHVIFDNFSGPIGAVREGKVRGLAVTSPQRSPVAPELPALAEFLPGFDITSWNGVVGPAGIPAEMVHRMATLAHRALQSPELVRNYSESGATPWPIGPEEYATYAREQEKVMRRLVQISGAKPE
jgi:tripartite-type tricarboxylate transporter receptor subunit TctC